MSLIVTQVLSHFFFYDSIMFCSTWHWQHWTDMYIFIFANRISIFLNQLEPRVCKHFTPITMTRSA